MIVRFAHSQVDIDRRRLTRGDEVIPLSTADADVLRHLAEHAGDVVTRESLLQDVLGFSSTSTSRAADSAVFRLRQKIEIDPADPDYILTVRGKGYRFVPHQNAEPAAPGSPDPDPRDESIPLPRAVDTFLGRAKEFGRIMAELEADRLVSLVGSGGAGKTRLALEVGRAWQGRVTFCDCTTATGAEAMWSRIGQVLGVAGDPAVVLDRLSALRGLLILDNLEQVEGANEVVAAIAVRRGANLCTTRHELAIRGEHVVRLEPMALAEAVALLMARGRARRPALQLEQEVAERIVTQLDRMPLPIELAASRLSVMGLQQLESALHKQRLLQTRDASRPDRHQGLDAAHAWSWGLLSGSEQAALMALCTLPGDTDLNLAEALALTADPTGPSPIDLLQGLVAKSWVHTVEAGAEMRFGVFVTTRAFVKARSNKTIAAAALHAAGSVLARLRSADVGALLQQERNLLAAFAHAVDHDTPQALTLVAAIRHLLPHSTGTQGLGLLERLASRDLSAADEAAVATARVQVLLSRYELEQAEAAGLAALERLDAHTADEPFHRGALCILLGNIRSQLGRGAEAISSYEAAAGAYRACGNPKGEALSRADIAMHRMASGDPEGALRTLDELEQLWIEDASGWLEGMTRARRGVASTALGLFDRAESELLAALQLHKRQSLRRNVAIVYINLGWLYYETGNWEAARTVWVQGRSIAQDLGAGLLILHADLGLATLDIAHGDPVHGELAALEALASASRYGNGLMAQERLHLARVLPPGRHTLAWRLASEAHGSLSRKQDTLSAGAASAVLGELAMAAGRRAEAEARHTEALAYAVPYTGFPESIAQRRLRELEASLESGG